MIINCSSASSYHYDTKFKFAILKKQENIKFDKKYLKKGSNHSKVKK